MPRIRVLHVIKSLNYGGMERLLADLGRRIRPDRFEVHVLCLRYFGRFAEGLEKCVELHLAERLPRYSMIWPVRLAAQISSIGPDVIHTHSGVWYKASLAARMAKVPRVIHTDHGRRSPDPRIHRLLDRMAARRTDVVVAVSEALARQLEQTVVPKACRVEVVWNGVDVDLFRPRPDNGTLRRELGFAQNSPIIGSIGRLEAIKGYEIMIEAFAHLLRHPWDSPPPTLVIAGHGSERQRLEELRDRWNLHDSVHLLGWRDDVHDLLAAFTLFTMSSHSEGTSVSLLEAMSTGLCPVVTEVGGNRAVLGRKLRQRLVPPDNPTALAQAWSKALHNADQRNADADAARNRVKSRFSLNAMVEAYERLYGEQV